MANARLTFVHVLSSLHAGTGQGSGVIDLPIAREKSTGIPFLPGSSLKGTLRSRCLNTGKSELAHNLFGNSSDPNEMDGSVSQVQFSDQRLLLLPIRSLAGTFAWVTSPYILYRLSRDIKEMQSNAQLPIPQVKDISTCYTVSKDCAIILPQQAHTVYLEDLDLKAQVHEQIAGVEPVAAWATWIAQQLFSDNAAYWQEALRQRLCIVHDDVFNFMLTTATEITTRIRLREDSKTVVDGGLWYEESLPTETVLSGITLATPLNPANGSANARKTPLTSETIFKELKALTNTTLQLGGKATVGRGMCRVVLAEEK